MRSGTAQLQLRLLLAAFLVLWEPLAFASAFTATSASIAWRGLPAVVELVWAGVVAVTCVAAAWSLWAHAPHGVPLARVALAASALRDVQSLYATWLPSNAMPGTRGILAAISIGAAAAGWMVSLAVARFGSGN